MGFIPFTRAIYFARRPPMMIPVFVCDMRVAVCRWTCKALASLVRQQHLQQ